MTTIKNPEICTCYLSDIERLPLPRFRMICHCQTCQDFLKSDFNDECVYLLTDCDELDLTDVVFKSYQAGFSPVKRGICGRCNKPSFCRIKIGFLPEFLTVPSTLVSVHKVPDATGHVYYHGRVADADDEWKKVSGHYLSQLFIAYSGIKALLK